MQILVLGATGAVGILLIQKALAKQHTVLVYARTPSKLPKDIIFHPHVQVFQGSLSDSDALGRVFEVEGGVDAVVSALGPPVLGVHPSGNPLAHGYQKVIEIAKRKGVKRFIVLGTASIKDLENDKSDLRFKALVTGVATFAPHAYHDVVAIGHVFDQEPDLEWTIARVPVLTSEEKGDYIATYIGCAHLYLSRAAFATFVVDELESRQWIRKRPMVSNP